MESILSFTPPQLPPMMTGAQFSQYVSQLYPELAQEDDHLRDLSAAMDAYGFACREYQARNSHFGEWMEWYKMNPTEKNKVVAFAIEHNVCFSSARSALQMLDAAVARLVEAWGDRNNLSSIRTVLANVDSESKKLAGNLQALQAAAAPGGQPQILPQKRPVPPPARSPEASQTS